MCRHVSSSITSFRNVHTDHWRYGAPSTWHTKWCQRDCFHCPKSCSTLRQWHEQLRSCASKHLQLNAIQTEVLYWFGAITQLSEVLSVPGQYALLWALSRIDWLTALRHISTQRLLVPSAAKEPRRFIVQKKSRVVRGTDQQLGRFVTWSHNSCRAGRSRLLLGRRSVLMVDC